MSIRSVGPFVERRPLCGVWSGKLGTSLGPVRGVPQLGGGRRPSGLASLVGRSGASFGIFSLRPACDSQRRTGTDQGNPTV